MTPIYLDNNATTFMTKEVMEAMHLCHGENYANPASSHQQGRRARRRLEQSRDAVAALLGARQAGTQADRLVFTSGGTESNNLALAGLAAARPGQVIVSSIEHPSVAATADRLEQQGRRVVRLPADPTGRTVVDELPRLLAEPTAAVSVMWANNETGVVQPIERIAACCAAADTPFHSDAVQAIGKLPLRFDEVEGLAAITFNAHKLHGPCSIGGLLLTNATQLEPLIVGGFQQLGTRPGTESVALAAGMEAALTAAVEQRGARTAWMRSRRDQFESLLREQTTEAVIIGGDADRLPHTSCIAFPGVDRQALLMQLDQLGVACSTGSACASGSSEPSPVLLAMGLDREIVEGALRFSLSFLTTEAEVVEAAKRLGAALRNLPPTRGTSNERY